MKKSIRITEGEFRKTLTEAVRQKLEAVMNEAYDYDAWQKKLQGIKDKSAELDGRLANNNDNSMDELCSQFSEKVSEVDRKFKEAKEFKRRAASELNQAIEPIRNKAVIIYIKEKDIRTGTGKREYTKFPARIEKIDWFGEHIYIHYQPLASGNSVIINVISSEKFDFSSIRIIPISEEEGDSFRDTSPWGFFNSDD